MLRHVVNFKWKPETTADDVAAIAAGLAALPGRIAAIRRFEFGPDVGANATSWDFAVVADFDDAAGYVEYRDHPDHQAFIAEHIAPHAEARASVQYQL